MSTSSQDIRAMLQSDLGDSADRFPYVPLENFKESQQYRDSNRSEGYFAIDKTSQKKVIINIYVGESMELPAPWKHYVCNLLCLQTCPNALKLVGGGLIRKVEYGVEKWHWYTIVENHTMRTLSELISNQLSLPPSLGTRMQWALALLLQLDHLVTNHRAAGYIFLPHVLINESNQLLLFPFSMSFAAQLKFFLDFPPEFSSSAEKFSEASDVFQASIVVQRIIGWCMEQNIESEKILKTLTAAVHPRSSERLVTTLKRCMARDPKERPTIKELIKIVESALNPLRHAEICSFLKGTISDAAQLVIEYDHECSSSHIGSCGL